MSQNSAHQKRGIHVFHISSFPIVFNLKPKSNCRMYMPRFVLYPTKLFIIMPSPKTKLWKVGPTSKTPQRHETCQSRLSDCAEKYCNQTALQSHGGIE